jgi:hypothetical protein
MALFVRKIEYSKWAQRRILEGEQPSADAITNCMKTTRNTLSLWSIRDEGELDEAVLAIAAQGDHLDTIDVLKINPSLIKDRGLHVLKSQGLTPYAGFVNNHLDVVELDYTSLGIMAGVIVESIRHGGWKRVTFGELKRILTKAIEEGKVEMVELKPDVQKKINNK